jgi:hypothetical protein
MIIEIEKILERISSHGPEIERKLQVKVHKKIGNRAYTN